MSADVTPAVGWFKAGARAHYSDGGERCLCGRYQTPDSGLADMPPVREHVTCSRLFVAVRQEARKAEAVWAKQAPVQLKAVPDPETLPEAEPEPAPEPQGRVVTEARLVDDVPEDVYHSGGVRTPGPQVSQSGLKKLVPPGTPREFQQVLLDGGLPRTRALDWGTAAHSLILGRGQAFVRHPDELLNAVGAMNSTKESKAWIGEQRAAGKVVLSGADFDGIHVMAAEILHNEQVAEILTDPNLRPEVSAYFPWGVPGLWGRARFDLSGDGVLDDLKTTKDPHPEAWRRQAWGLGYHVQDAAYRLALMESTGRDDPGPMRFIVVGSAAPYLSGVYTLDADFQRFGREQLLAALEVYREQYDRHGDPKAPGVRWDGLPSGEAVLSPPRSAYWDAEGVEYEPEF